MAKEGVPSLMGLPEVKSIASKHGKTPAQVLLRWATSMGVSVIPKSSNEKRLVENLDADSFDLTEEEMNTLMSLDKGLRFNDPAQFANTPIYD